MVLWVQASMKQLLNFDVVDASYFNQTHSHADMCHIFKLNHSKTILNLIIII
jgi:hypothetical protein